MDRLRRKVPAAGKLVDRILDESSAEAAELERSSLPSRALGQQERGSIPALVPGDDEPGPMGIDEFHARQRE